MSTCLFLPVEKLRDVIDLMSSFYRYVLDPEVQFTAEGRLSPGPMARFSNMPPAPLLTQNMHVPDNWLVEAVASPYDLDNIRLEEVDSVVHRSVCVYTFIVQLIPVQVIGTIQDTFLLNLISPCLF